ncbi:FecR family protein [Chitinophaga polysaccharea]|uniref:FecR family protein n=1 Tax=Chitinophaga polysaccharea TaxID=1293035 RepID=A0A561PXS4_9BACT|nr:FecR family protein [Chitinophaga polysaccharea]TWF42905.1 FecR family protein [Chitinophaga polysaccharea]
MENARELFIRFLNNKCTEEEIAQLMDAFASGEDAATFNDILYRQLEAGSDDQDYTVEIQEVYHYIERRIGQEVKLGQPRLLWIQLAIAASVVFLIGIGCWLFFNRKSSNPIAAAKSISTKDFEPGSAKAILTLANGDVVGLDSAGIGALAKQGPASISKPDSGQLVYSANGTPAKILYNTITVPRGGHYEVTLSDGTKVWLNAASSIHFPTAFAGSQRVVEITGEAYLEVAKQTSMPFTVKSGVTEIKVLGTHFNINSYPEEGDAKVTLLEGKVVVSIHQGHDSRLLNPGQQARINPAGNNISVLADVDTESEIAWKSNLFYFKNADIKAIMRELGRWYNIEVSYEGVIPERAFSGKISRNTNISNVLKILEQSKIHFRVTPQGIVVTP